MLVIDRINIALLVCETQSCDMRRLKNTAQWSPNGLQRAAKVSSERYRIHVIDRAAQILTASASIIKELSVSEIGSRTGLHQSTAHRS